ncbi:MAG TPA: sugar-transfer associated ATP-grasp domain-containing protein [Herpetosiphonaceae bacterium]|nr:sugar-transfer associated ATP-grasp domain-containing protein [Herpetosiphonaceae bacterium]
MRARHVLKQSVLQRYYDIMLVKTAVVVRKRTGKPLWSQAREVITLWRGPGRLKPFDYYAYELYDDRRYSFAEKKEFVSWRGYLPKLLNRPEWKAVCDDKLMTYSLFRGLCLPHPPVYAVFHPGSRTCGPIPVLRTREDMADFLRRDMTYPFFGKPAQDWRGGGASSVDAINRERDVLLLTTGAEIDVEEYVQSVPMTYCRGQKIRSRDPAGYLFQARVRQHPLIDRLSGGRVSSLRLVVLLWPDGPRLHRVRWRLGVGKNVTDHAISGSGNLNCSINPKTGRVERVLASMGPEGTKYRALGEEGTPVEHHPDTQEPIMGIQLPYWDRTVSLCLHAAAALPGVRYQSWDIVMGSDGPLFLEVNQHGAIVQIPGCRGFNDVEFRQFMSSIRKT